VNNAGVLVSRPAFDITADMHSEEAVDAIHLRPAQVCERLSPYSPDELIRPSGDHNNRISTGRAAREPGNGRALTTSRRVSIERSRTSIPSAGMAAAPPASPADSMANLRLWVSGTLACAASSRTETSPLPPISPRPRIGGCLHLQNANVLKVGVHEFAFVARLRTSKSTCAPVL
jgi:hypothetical protein